MNASNETVVLPMRGWDRGAHGGWWPLALSEEVSGEKPTGRMCAGDPVVLFRDRTGTVRALEDRCPHRRAPLSLGRMTPEGRLQCGYHGWTYEGETGACTAIPNLSDTERVPARYGARTWQVIERDGFVFVRAGDDDGFEASTVVEGAPEPCAHPFAGSAVVSLSHDNYDAALADAPHLLMSIAGLRVTEYVTSDPGLRNGRVTMGRGVVTSRRRVNHRFVTEYQDVRAVVHVHVRNSVALAYGRYTPGFHVPLFHPCVPESRDRCRLNFAMNTTAAPGPFRIMMPRAAYIVGPQDNIMVGPQSSRYTEPTGVICIRVSTARGHVIAF